MVVLLDGVKNVGEEAKCKWCDSIVHYEPADMLKIEHYYHDGIRICPAINCPKCYCVIYLCEDK